MKMRIALPCLVVAALSAVGCQKLKSSISDKLSGDGGGIVPGMGGASSVLASFEGELGLRFESQKDKKNIDIALTIKKDRVRAAIPEGFEEAKRFGKGYVLFHGAEKKIYGVIDSQKQIVVVDLDQMSAQAKGRPVPGGPEGVAPKPQAMPKFTVKRTGNKDTVAGRSCEDWSIEGEKGQSALLCVAEEGASWLSFPSKILPGEYALFSELLDGKHFPLRLIAQESGKEVMRIYATKLEKKAIADSVFDLPTGYTQVDLMAFLMQGLGGMQGGRMNTIPRNGGLVVPPGQKRKTF